MRTSIAERLARQPVLQRLFPRDDVAALDLLRRRVVELDLRPARAGGPRPLAALPRPLALPAAPSAAIAWTKVTVSPRGVKA